MRKCKSILCGVGLLILVGLPVRVLAQAGVAAPGAPAGGVPGGPPNIFTLLCPNAQQLAACKAKFCCCPLGQLLSNGMTQASAMSGGMIQPCCPVGPDPAGLAKPADTAAGAAARIAQDEAEAKGRRVAVRYLGTVDCRRWPEAEEGLINALRGDRNECVRLEAAWVLGRGCCCTAKTVEALSITVSGSERDGFPAEGSDRVKRAAAASLTHCLACLTEKAHLVPPPAYRPLPVPKAAPPEELPPPGEKGPISPVAYYKALGRQPVAQVAGNAQRVLGKQPLAPQAPVQPRPVGTNGVLELIQYAVTPSPVPTVTTAAAQASAPQANAIQPAVQPAAPAAEIPNSVPAQQENSTPSAAAPGDGQSALNLPAAAPASAAPVEHPQ